MSDLSASMLPFFGYFGAELARQATDAALGAGALVIDAPPPGVSLSLPLGDGRAIGFKNVSIRKGNFSGRMTIDGLSAARPLDTTLFDGFGIGLTGFDVTLADGVLEKSLVAGRIEVPFFTESGRTKSLDVELGLRADGKPSVALAATQSVQPMTCDGLVQLKYAIGAAVTIEIQVASIEIEEAPDESWRILLAGRLAVATADLQWPSFELQGLGIDSKGHVSIDGGWINLPSQTALDFYGFHIALQRLGFGADADGRWIGFNGDIHLVEGLSLGGSVRGLRISLDTGAVSFSGVGVDFRIPGALSFKGDIDHIHVDANKPEELSAAGLLPSLFDEIHNAPGQPPLPRKVDVFAGQVAIAVDAVPGLQIDGKFIVGHFGGASVFFLALDVELPTGIPIFTNVSLYGLNGLVASNLQPHPEPGHSWWEWYKYPTKDAGIDLSAKPDYDATAVRKWLDPEEGAFAIGAGATIGTSADDGYTVSAAVTLMLMLPGPVIALVGKANILSKRIGGAEQDANFQAMAVYDGGAATFDLSIDAHYEIPVVLSIDGGAELHVDPNAPAPDPHWFFALGRPPHEKRIKARVFDVFETNAYLVVSDRGLVTGAWTGYRDGWRFGPLSVSLDAYQALLVAIQWSPLQMAGGVELHGEVHLRAFGVGLGVTMDALLEGCAPDPFWVHGEFSVELELPWPLPDIGATVSLSWGGDNGAVPPAPLALGAVAATIADHADRESQPVGDRYELLAHRLGGPWPDSAVRYDDPQRPGLLAPDAASDTAWRARVSGVDPSRPEHLRGILPDLDPATAGTDRFAPVTPQDAHFLLSFSRPVIDNAGFSGATSPAPGVVTVEVPSIVGKDDMSNINPQPPSVQWLQRHSLQQVALYRHDDTGWRLVCALPESDPANETRLDGVWLEARKGDPDAARQTRLKLFPWRMLPGEAKSAAWGALSKSRPLANSFRDQGLQFSLESGLSPAEILQDGLTTSVPKGATARLRIFFPAPVQIGSLISVEISGSGEFVNYNPPVWLGDGAPLQFASAAKDAAGRMWTQTTIAQTPAITELSVVLNSSRLVLAGIDYRMPDIKMAILPEAPALYAIQTVTRIEAGRVNGADVAFKDAADGNPVVEFAYFQTVTGPGLAVVDAPAAPEQQPSPRENAPFPALSLNCSQARVPPNDTPSAQQPASAFPLGGALADLKTYAQWSWPEDGAASAYYGYDVNVEFVETYVNALYTAFSGGSIRQSLHFRCVDRNQRHSLLRPVAIHVPSVPQYAALVALPLVPQFPASLAPGGKDLRFRKEVANILSSRAKLSEEGFDVADVPQLGGRPPVAQSVIRRLQGPGAPSLAQKLSPGAAATLVGLQKEQEDAAAARAAWFRPLAPQTHYTIDVVAGPLTGQRRLNGEAGLDAVFGAQSARAARAALEAYYRRENGLTSLLRVQFATSRYATFSDQIATVVAQIAVAGAEPARLPKFIAATDPRGWLADPAHRETQRIALQSQWQDQAKHLAERVRAFDPVADIKQADGAPAGNGAAAIVAARRATNEAWSAFSRTTVGAFDGLAAALGRPELAGVDHPNIAPVTEASLFLDAARDHAVALLIESPEPLPWRRIWRWISVTGAAEPAIAPLGRQVVLWNGDGSRGLIVFAAPLSGAIRIGVEFHGDIGAEAPCITRGGNEALEYVDLGVLHIAARKRRAGRKRPG